MLEYPQPDACVYGRPMVLARVSAVVELGEHEVGQRRCSMVVVSRVKSKHEATRQSYSSIFGSLLFGG